MDTLTVLIEARKLIEKPKNWCHKGGRKGVAVCSILAINEAAGQSGRAHHGAVKALVQVISHPIIAVWNDHPRRKHSEVLAAFDKAIATERAKFEAQFLDPQQTQSDCTEPNFTRAAAELVP